MCGGCRAGRGAERSAGAVGGESFPPLKPLFWFSFSLTRLMSEGEMLRMSWCGGENCRGEDLGCGGKKWGIWVLERVAMSLFNRAGCRRGVLAGEGRSRG